MGAVFDFLYRQQIFNQDANAVGDSANPPQVLFFGTIHRGNIQMSPFRKLPYSKVIQKHLGQMT
jgi:hypothetical protein